MTQLSRRQVPCARSCSRGLSDDATQRSEAGRSPSPCTPQLSASLSGLADSSCPWQVDPHSFHDTCMDLHCSGAGTDAICETFASYARECAQQSVAVNWRQPGFCGAEKERSVPKVCVLHP